MEIRQNVSKPDVIGYICDVCHNSCYKEEGEHRRWSTEMASLTASWGYWSNGRDVTFHECHMCEDCFDRVVEYIETLGGTVRQIGHEIRPFVPTGPERMKKKGRDYIIVPEGQEPPDHL